MKKTPIKRKPGLRSSPKSSSLPKVSIDKKVKHPKKPSKRTPLGVKKRKHNIAKKNKRKYLSKSSPLWRAISKCDVAFSRWIRLSHADSKGIVKCFTCDFKAFFKQCGIECGHYKSRGCMSLRWDPYNAKPQCIQCNQFLGGNLTIFKQGLEELYSVETVIWLEKESKRVKSLTIKYVLELTSDIEAEVEQLLKKIKINE